jgi:hypothetical protein
MPLQKLEQALGYLEENKERIWALEECTDCPLRGMLSSSYTATSCGRERRGEKQNAVAYAAKEVHGGMAVTRPP